MKPTPLRAVCLGGFLYGSIVYGLVLSLIHVLHNRLGMRDALVTRVIFALLYGLGAAAVVLLGYVLARRRVERGAWIGLLLVDLGFWELFWRHGLTYDQYRFGRLSAA